MDSGTVTVSLRAAAAWCVSAVIWRGRAAAAWCESAVAGYGLAAAAWCVSAVVWRGVSASSASTWADDLAQERCSSER